MNNRFKLYQQVVLSQNIPDEGLQKGDVATVVEIIDKNGKVGYCLEFFDSDGATLKVIVVNENGITAPKPHSVVNYREAQV